jgi:quinoprotein glucose dehydrogenase
MIVLGGWLIGLGGTAYYLLAGLILVAGSLLLWRRSHGAGVAAFGLAALVTFAWSLWEIAAKGWMPSWGFDLAGRMAVVTALFVLSGLAWAMGRRGPSATMGRYLAIGSTGTALVAALTILFVSWERPYRPSDPEAPDLRAQSDSPAKPVNTAEEWTAYGGSNLGHRFSPASQITPANVGRLRKAWEFSARDLAPNERVYFSSQNTPLKIGDSLYACSSSNKVFALDPTTGAVQWQFDPEVPPRAMESLFSVACRAVGYHEQQGTQTTEDCGRRVFVATADGRLIALDVSRGSLCGGFGTNGVVDLTEGMDMGEPGFASNTSGPTVAGGLVLVGQQVSDNQRRDAPSGVVRAYDATTGELRWAWDAERIDRPQEPLAEGEVWPRGTPNVWNVISADETLGLALLGTGNAANDHFGGNRSEADDLFSSAVVAVELASGRTRWVFRTVEKDRWDYDIGAQPVIADIPVEGELRRAVIQATKTGSIFVLDAETGNPLRPVEMRPAPQGGVPGERMAPAQPQSIFYPNFAGAPGADPERIDARHAFGVTPLDAAWCRIQFHQMRYEGIYTPPTEQPAGMLLHPGTIGGPNWGGIAVDLTRNIMITNHSRLANRVRLVPRVDVRDLAVGDGGARPDQEVAPQKGAPWGVDRPIWVSPLNVPCISPPWGYLAATDLESGRLLWSRPLGTGYDTGPLGMSTRLRVPIGTPNIGGAVVTASGLTFIAAAQDNYLRAYETTSGRLLWSARLPAGGQAGPMTYMHNGKQYVAISATGHARLETAAGDSLVVYTLD